MRPALSFLILLIFVGCYDPGGENFVEHASPNLSGVEISIKPSDLLVFQKTNLNVKFTTNGPTLEKLEGFINDVSLFVPESPKQVIIDPAMFGSGKFKLHLVATVKVKTESVAGQFGLEVSSFARDFDLVIDLTPPESINKLNYRIEDGRFILEWDKPTKLNFSNYLLKKYLKNGDTWSTFAERQMLINRQKSSFRDSTYLGGPVRYKMELVSDDITVIGSNNDFDVPSIKFSFEQESGLNYRLFWETTFYNSAEGVILGNLGPDMHFDSQPHSITKEIEFGDYYYPAFSVFSNSTRSSTWGNEKLYAGRELVFEDNLTEVQGAPIKLGNKSYVVEQRDVFIVNEVDEVTMSIQRRQSYSHLLGLNPVTESGYANRQLIVNSSKTDAYLFVGQYAYRFDDNFQHIQTVNLTPIVQTGSRSFVYGTQIYGNVLAGFVDYSDFETKLINLNNLTVIFQPDNNDPFLLTSDGHHYIHSDNVYEIIDNNSVVKIWTLPTKSGQLVGTNNSNQFVQSSGGFVYLYDIATKSEIMRYDNKSFFGELSYDMGSNKVGGHNREIYNVIDLSSHVVNNYKVFTNATYFLRNNKLYSTNGFVLDL
ncbi:MAG: hypothetical protein R2820_06710 [Cyclobacteriaceae bacterium]|nr:hypothetical protein [Cyclobacteriaceae bacterium]